MTHIGLHRAPRCQPTRCQPAYGQHDRQQQNEKGSKNSHYRSIAVDVARKLTEQKQYGTAQDHPSRVVFFAIWFESIIFTFDRTNLCLSIQSPFLLAVCAATL